MYALVEINGKQFRVEKGTVLTVDKLPDDEGSEVDIGEVMLVCSDDAVKVGTPYVSGASVKAEIDSHVRDKKVVVFKRKRRKNYRRTRGHRQRYSVIHVKDITTG